MGAKKSLFLIYLFVYWVVWIAENSTLSSKAFISDLFLALHLLARSIEYAENLNHIVPFIAHFSV